MEWRQVGSQIATEVDTKYTVAVGTWVHNETGAGRFLVVGTKIHGM